MYRLFVSPHSPIRYLMLTLPGPVRRLYPSTVPREGCAPCVPPQFHQKVVSLVSPHSSTRRLSSLCPSTVPLEGCLPCVPPQIHQKVVSLVIPHGFIRRNMSLVSLYSSIRRNVSLMSLHSSFRNVSLVSFHSPIKGYTPPSIVPSYGCASVLEQAFNRDSRFTEQRPVNQKSCVPHREARTPHRGNCRWGSEAPMAVGGDESRSYVHNAMGSLCSPGSSLVLGGGAFRAGDGTPTHSIPSPKPDQKIMTWNEICFCQKTSRSAVLIRPTSPRIGEAIPACRRLATPTSKE